MPHLLLTDCYIYKRWLNEEFYGTRKNADFNKNIVFLVQTSLLYQSDIRLILFWIQLLNDFWCFRKIYLNIWNKRYFCQTESFLEMLWLTFDLSLAPFKNFKLFPCKILPKYLDFTNLDNFTKKSSKTNTYILLKKQTDDFNLIKSFPKH
jgi:hypothetical protein